MSDGYPEWGDRAWQKLTLRLPFARDGGGRGCRGCGVGAGCVAMSNLLAPVLRNLGPRIRGGKREKGPKGVLSARGRKEKHGGSGTFLLQRGQG